MKKLAPFLVLLLVLVMISVASADSHPVVCPPACDGDEVLIFPYRFAPGTEVTLRPDQFVTLGARYGACTSGLVEMGKRSVVLDWNVDGVSRQAAWPGSREEWGATWADYSSHLIDDCVTRREAIWWTYFEWPLGYLGIGDYPVYLRYGLRFPVIDGADYDGDKRPDRFYDPITISDIVLHVEEQ